MDAEDERSKAPPLDGEFYPTFEVWKKYEEIAMHFNDLISRLRFQALAGVAGLSASIGLLADKLAGDGKTPESIASWAFGVLAILWVALFALDFFYYNRLLIGAVEEIQRLEKHSRRSDRVGMIAFSLSVTSAVDVPVLSGLTRRGQRGPLVFYGIVFVCLVVLAFMADRGVTSADGGTGQGVVTTPGSPGAPGTPGTPCTPCAPPCSPCTSTPMPPPPGSEATAPTPPVPIPDMVRLWDALKKARAQQAGTLRDIASLVDSGARLLQPLLEKTGETASQALELGKAFFQHFAESAGDEAGKRTVEAVFDYFSGEDSTAKPVTDPRQATRTFSVQRGVVRFDLDRYVVAPSGQATINGLVAASPRARTFWLIVGSTDRSGSEARNTALAKQRVEAVAAYLKARGVDERLIIERPLSELAAPVPGYDGGRDPENRRTEIFLLIVNPG